MPKLMRSYLHRSQSQNEVPTDNGANQGMLIVYKSMNSHESNKYEI